MTATRAGQTAQRAAQSKTLTRTAQAGFIGYGLLHLLIAWLAVQIAFGRSSAEGDQSGAFALLARNGVGRVVLIAVIVGLVAMAIWQALVAAVGHRNREGLRRVAERVAAAGRALVYALLAFSAGRIVASPGSSSAEHQQQATAGALGSAGGRALVVLAGLAVLGLGAGFVVFGLTGKFEENLRIERMSQSVRRVGRVLGGFGYVAKGAAYGIVGGLLVTAAVTYAPERSRGLDAALRTLAGQPYGSLLLCAVALGFLAFGLYCLVQAGYRET